MSCEISSLKERLDQIGKQLNDLESLKNHYKILSKDNEYLQRKLYRLEQDNEDMEMRLNELIEEKDDDPFKRDIDMRIEKKQQIVSNLELILESNLESNSKSNDDASINEILEDVSTTQIDESIIDDNSPTKFSDETIDSIKDQNKNLIEPIKSNELRNELNTLDQITSSTKSKSNLHFEITESDLNLIKDDKMRLSREMNDYKSKYEDYKRKYDDFKSKYDRSQSKLNRTKKKYRSLKRERNELKEIEKDHDEYINKLKIDIRTTNDYLNKLEGKLKVSKRQINDCSNDQRLISKYENNLKILNEKLRENKTTELVHRREIRKLTNQLSLVNQDNVCKNCVLLNDEKDKYEHMYKSTVELLVFETTKK